jgi:hypothetical protein
LHAGSDHKVLGLVLLQHQPLHLDVVFGVTPVAQRTHVAQVQAVLQAQGDARRAGIVIPDGEVIRWLTLNAAKALGIDKDTGSLEAGKMGDVVLWNGNPLSTYSRPEKVWIDGALLFDSADPKRRPVSDFELGQPGEGDVK